mgnify:CR=1 FL=1|tara:strand:- start:263 stop:451 length:189 start_codon:yes stop_codon:yes gene_type:complete
MSVEHKNKENIHSEINSSHKRVNLTDLVKRLEIEKQKERKNNMIISAAAVSAVAVFGIILTL